MEWVERKFRVYLLSISIKVRQLLVLVFYTQGYLQSKSSIHKKHIGLAQSNGDYQ